MIVIADTGPLLHLFWVDALAWALPPQEIAVVEAVWREVAGYAPEALQDSRLRRISSYAPVPSSLTDRQLDTGEESALAYALAQQDRTDLLLLCDDQQARQACQELALPVTSTLGLIVAAFRLDCVSKDVAITALVELPKRSRFYVKPALIAQTLAALDAGEMHWGHNELAGGSNGSLAQKELLAQVRPRVDAWIDRVNIYGIATKGETQA